MLLFDWEKTLQNMMMDYSIHKVIFLILLHKTAFDNFRLFFIKLMFMYEVGKWPKHSGSESLLLLRHCRLDIKKSNLKKTETATLSQLELDEYHLVSIKLPRTFSLFSPSTKSWLVISFILDWLFDWLTDTYGFTPYRQYFSHITAVLIFEECTKDTEAV